VTREVDEEIDAHLAMRTEELVASGMDAAAARAEARRRFGEAAARRRLLAGARRRDRRRHWREGCEQLRADVRLALRHARRAPGFAAVALAIFASGVGLTTSMFSVADHVLLRPLPHPDPQDLVALWSVQEEGTSFSRVSMANWVDWKEGSSTLEGTALHAVRRSAVATGDDAFYVTTAQVAGPFFGTLGIPFLVGRGFTEEEAQNDASLAVVSEGLWRRALGGVTPLRDIDLVVTGRRREVVGVVPEAEGFPLDVEIWEPHPYRPGSGGMRNNINYEAVARLREGASLEQARVELSGIARGIRESDPEALYSWGVDVKPLRDVVVGEARTYLVLLSAAVAFLLLVACVNLAGLGLARARRRAQESAVHLALGAGRGRLVRRAMTEHVVLALAGGAAGVAIAWLTTGALMSRVAALVPRAQEVEFDLRVAAFGAAAALASGLLAGIVPALTGSRGAAALSGVRGAVSGGRGLPGAVMVGTEIALAVALLVAGGLLVRSFQAVVSRDLGYQAENVITADVTLTSAPYWESMDARVAYWHQVLERVGTLPGIVAVGIGNWIPTSDGGSGFIEVAGGDEPNIGAGYRVVSDRYFDALGIPLLSGRRFDATDGAGTERVAIVNESMADRYWRDVDPLGQRVRATSMESWMHGGTAPWLTVVGVVGDVRHYGFEHAPAPEMYALHRQIPSWTGAMTVVAKVSTATPRLGDAIREAIRDADPSLAVELGSMEARVARLTAERRMVLAGIGTFGAAALLLVCLGVYGLMSFAAGQRTREMAVRAALGAERERLVRLMLGGALRVVAAGVAGGLLAAYVFSRLLTGLLVEVRASDPLTYGAAAALLAAVALLAALAPSLRAARGNPVEALRSDG
jgi:putative ABC transport system permease protein